jgi:glycerophosphoryl diester phosphodiesterase
MRTLFHSSAVAGLLICASCANRPPLGSPQDVLVIAHRGDSRMAPENTLSAFRCAMKTGATYVELDGQPSADGTLYVLHDKTLDRTTDAKAVFKKEKIRLSQTGDADLNRLDAGKWFDAKYTGEPLPTLAGALDVIQNGSRTLIERKDGTAEAYAKLLRDKGLVGKLVVQSFDWEFLTAMHKLEPNQPLGALGEKEITEAKVVQIKTTGAVVVAWSYKDLNGPAITNLHWHGYKVWAWTADEPADWQRLLACGVDGIITNCPGQLKAYLAQKTPAAPR